MTEDAVTETAQVQTHPEWKNAVQLFVEAGFTYGSRIPDEWFYRAFNLVEPTDDTGWREKQRIDLAYLRNITAMREWLLTELQMLLWSDPQGGYEVVPPREQVGRAMGDFNVKITKEFTKVATRLRHTALDQLTSDEQRRHADACARVAQLSGMMLGARSRQARIEAARAGGATPS
jgi:hypothetical protein